MTALTADTAKAACKEAHEEDKKARRRLIMQFWCTLSIVVNTSMCGLTWFLMLCWIACYDGNISDLATYVVPVTLVLNLDFSYVSTDSNLVENYRTLVRRLRKQKEVEKKVVTNGEESGFV